MRIWTIMAVIAALLLAASPAAMAGEFERDDWYIGFGMGLGVSESVSDSTGSYSFEDFLILVMVTQRNFHLFSWFICTVFNASKLSIR